MAKNRSKPVEEDSDGDSFFDEDDSYDFDDEDNCDLNEDTTSADKPVHSQPAKISKRLLQLKERLGINSKINLCIISPAVTESILSRAG